MSYKQSYDNYDIEVIPVGDKFDVQFTIKGETPCTFSIEKCDTAQHATIGAKNFPAFYELALKYGYKIKGDEFRHSDGRVVGLDIAMDTDRTTLSFEQMLIKGETIHPFL